MQGRCLRWTRALSFPHLPAVSSLRNHRCLSSAALMSTHDNEKQVGRGKRGWWWAGLYGKVWALRNDEEVVAWKEWGVGDKEAEKATGEEKSG